MVHGLENYPKNWLWKITSMEQWYMSLFMIILVDSIPTLGTKSTKNPVAKPKTCYKWHGFYNKATS